jgi:signal transduction histidine kinase
MLIISRIAELLPAGLARRLARAFVGLVAGTLAINGAINMWLSYEEATSSAVGVQREKALAASERVAQFIGEIESQMGWTTRAEWARISVDQRRYDFIRMLRQAPAITEALFIDGQGREQLRLSRLEPDAVGGGVDLSKDERFVRAVTDRVWYGPVYYRRGSEPYMTLSLAHAGRNPSVTSVGVNLKLIWDVISALRVGEEGYAYVTDAAGRLIAHPDMSLVLRETDLSGLPQVARAIRAAKGEGEWTSTEGVTGPNGRVVLSASAMVPRLGWLVFVEIPQREVLAPVMTSLYQTLALLALSTLLALLLGGYLARRMAKPIRQLQAGAERLGEGELSQRVPVMGRDEIGKLAERFNSMADRIQEAQETLEQKVRDRTQELQQSLEDLHAAQDRLVQSEKLASLGQLTAGIAHEIKNPLNFINNFSALSVELVDEIDAALKNADLDDKTRAEIADSYGLLKANLERVVQHGKRADSIVKNMLLHSRAGSGERREADVNMLVEESLNLAFHGARAEKPGFNVTLTRELDPAAGMASVFPQEIARVLLNLVANGFYATSKRREQEASGYEPTLAAVTRDLGDRVEIRIRDNGVGIPDEVKAKMFNPFFTTKPAGEGTGLGLSLSHDIVVKQHGGAIDVATEPGAFTEFTITLPRKTAQGLLSQ